MITSPGMGIYNDENRGSRRHEIFHEPQIGYNGSDGGWCKVCKKLKHYSWVDKGEQCKPCNDREKNKTIQRTRCASR